MIPLFLPPKSGVPSSLKEQFSQKAGRKQRRLEDFKDYLKANGLVLVNGYGFLYSASLCF